MSTNTPPSAKTWYGTILDAIVAYYSANEAALSALVASYNAPLEQLIETGLNDLLAKEPLLKMILGGEVAALPSQLDPMLVKEEGYAEAAILAYLQGLATKYGG